MIERLKAIYVEDEPCLRLTMLALMGDSFKVDTYPNYPSGERAIRALTEKPDLFITDITMPGGRGYNLIPFLRAKYDTPAIVVSGDPTDLDEARTALAGLAKVTFLEKPFRKQELQTAVNHAITGSFPQGQTEQ